ncbi:hypothetical protein HPP92_015948 [Vanilla planifolia]|uniref:Uncharacterized protein n=1 Tax=Vanilla planifolia TaxID=51239 RepID=A0A835URD5_VANPL|nr:hypothetical protein HPP92_016555 [Vanilla planifolia]KAG0471402.1 hypothetical protein HPP92_015948 [Vanilla planifolia]
MLSIEQIFAHTMYFLILFFFLKESRCLLQHFRLVITHRWNRCEVSSMPSNSIHHSNCQKKIEQIHQLELKNYASINNSKIKILKKEIIKLTDDKVLAKQCQNNLKLTT